jgi:hypothetical protein
MSKEPEGAPEAASHAKRPVPENKTEEGRQREQTRMRCYLAWYRGEYLRLVAIEEAAAAFVDFMQPAVPSPCHPTWAALVQALAVPETPHEPAVSSGATKEISL